LINYDPKSVYRRYTSLKETHPRKYAEVVESLRDMSRGGNGGGMYINYRGLVPIRKHYFPKWRDDQFTELLELLGEEN